MWGDFRLLSGSWSGERPLPCWHVACWGRPLGAPLNALRGARGEVREGSSGVSTGPCCKMSRVSGPGSLGILSVFHLPLTGRASGSRLGSHLFIPRLSVVFYVCVVVGSSGATTLQAGGRSRTGASADFLHITIVEVTDQVTFRKLVPVVNKRCQTDMCL